MLWTTNLVVVSFVPAVWDLGTGFRLILIMERKTGHVNTMCRTLTASWFDAASTSLHCTRLDEVFCFSGSSVALIKSYLKVSLGSVVVISLAT